MLAAAASAIFFSAEGVNVRPRELLLLLAVGTLLVYPGSISLTSPAVNYDLAKTSGAASPAVPPAGGAALVPRASAPKGPIGGSRPGRSWTHAPTKGPTWTNWSGGTSPGFASHACACRAVATARAPPGDQIHI